MLHLDGFEGFEEIGSGGFGTVYKARQVSLGRDVAIKVLQSSRVDVSKVEREIVALGRLSDIPNIITAYELRVLDDDRPALVMALMATSLGDLSRQGRVRTDDVVDRWLPQIAAALDAAHARNVFHRDLKPDNILISSAGDAYLADFGISGVDSLDSSTTTAYSLTPHHASPERFSGEVPDPVADDNYSLGSTIYSILAGTPPFGKVSDGGVLGLVRRVTANPVPPIEGQPEAVHAVFEKALATDPAQRYRSASEFASELRAAAGGDQRLPAADADVDLTHRRMPAVAPAAAVADPPATQPGQVEGAAPVVGRRRWMVAGVASVLAALVVVGALWVAKDGGPDGTEAAEEPPWREQLNDYYDETETPEGLVTCIADRLSERVGSPAEFVELYLTDVGYEPETESVDDSDVELGSAAVQGPGPGFEEQDGRSQIVNAIQNSCADEVLDIGGDVTVTGAATQVSLTRDSACALLSDDRTVCWGSNWDELAFDDEGFGPYRIDSPVLSQAPAAKRIISAPFSHRCVITLDDQLSCSDSTISWFAQMSADELFDEDASVTGTYSYLIGYDGVGEYSMVTDAGRVLDAALGAQHLCVVRVDGTVWCLGANEFGQLGVGDRSDRDQLTQVAGVVGATSVTAGVDHTCVTVAGGSVQCWGLNGVGFNWDVTAVTIEGLPPITQIAAGAGFTCGVGVDQSLSCWGALTEVIADRSNETTRAPVRINTEVGAVQVDAAGTRVCFATTDETMACFGEGRPLPKVVDNVTGIVQVGISETVTCGVDTAGEVDCVGAVGPVGENGEPSVLQGVFVVPGLGS